MFVKLLAYFGPIIIFVFGIYVSRATEVIKIGKSNPNYYTNYFQFSQMNVYK